MAEQSDRVNQESASTAARPLLRVIQFYQNLVSPTLGKNCRYLPTCSQYAHEAIARYGAWRGSLLALKRLGRCHPLREGGYDPVPRKDG